MNDGTGRPSRLPAKIVQIRQIVLQVAELIRGIVVPAAVAMQPIVLQVVEPVRGIADAAAERRPIGNSVDSSICRATVTSGIAARWSIAGRINRGNRANEGPVKATESPPGAIVCPIGVRNRPRTEQVV
ncbi:MAG: hypothetical protein O6922_00770 [Chloroflexi bacterium]|nr:hypothetical protein [Chloroflexota bacterium]